MSDFWIGLFVGTISATIGANIMFYHQKQDMVIEHHQQVEFLENQICLNSLHKVLATLPDGSYVCINGNENKE